MSAIPVELDEYCPSCGSWVSYLYFDQVRGWCSECVSLLPDQPRCIHCSELLPHKHRTTCDTCRQELWLTKHSDEIEFLVVTKGYSISHARLTIAKLSRPICQACGKPIKGGHEGALFHKGNNYRACHSLYNKYRRLLKSGLTPEVALGKIRVGS